MNKTLFANRLPANPLQFGRWSWSQIEPVYHELQRYPLNQENVVAWLVQWSHLAGLVYETYQRLYVGITRDTSDLQAEDRYNRFLDEIFTPAEAADQLLKEKILKSGLRPEGFEMPLRNLQAESEIFSQANLPLLAEEMKLSSKYDKIVGEQSVPWQGREVTLLYLRSVLREPDRGLRERAWRLEMGRWLQDRDAINNLWAELFAVRSRMAANAGMEDYRAYRWKKMLRFDYTPQDCKRFHQAIEKAAVPAAGFLYRRRREKLGLERLRPWDLNVDPQSRPALQPFARIEELEKGISRIFHQVDPVLGGYFDILRSENLLDLDNRKAKAPGGYCTEFPVSNRPFIFMNAVGTQEDVQTLLHEGGHAFHVFEINQLPYFQQKRIGLEFMEVASTAMELLGSPYFIREEGGFYSEQQAAQARIEFLETAICFWPYMAVVDAFQHWAYEHPKQAGEPIQCDRQWAELWERFMIGVDWDGLEVERTTGWQRKLHILQDPFYYIEYGLSQLGAFQIWRNYRTDPAGAVAAYRRALALGGTVPLPQLYVAAGAKLAFDADTLQEAIDLGIRTIEELDSI